MSAIEYNRSRHYTPTLWRHIQHVVGATPDGIPGPETTAAVRRWQAHHHLIPDGKVGPQTVIAIQNTLQEHDPDHPPPPAIIGQLGLWWDLSATWTTTHADHFAEHLSRMGVDWVAIMVDNSEPSPEPIWDWTPTQLDIFSSALRPHHITCWLTSWVRPTLRHIAASYEGIRDRLDAAQAIGWEWDLEGNWEARDVVGYPSLEAAGQALLARGRDLNTTLAMTTFPFHGELNPQTTAVAPFVDRLVPQAYATYREQNPGGYWGAYLGPGHHQNLALRRAQRVLNNDASLCCGLPAYGQHYPHHGVEHAMRVQLEAALLQRVHDVCYWSAKWLMPGSAVQDRRAYDFVSQIKKEYRP